jgi:aspartate/methionine/tyrosine aminotransferase
MLHFSARIPQLAPNSISRAVADARARGVDLFDLTETNPTAVGFASAPEDFSALVQPDVARYQPEPLGLPAARAAIAAEAGAAGSPIDPGRVVVTTSTSESYAWLFKLLCDAGDSVLVPAPSYPLFDSLAALEAVHARPYRLEYDGVWSIDREHFRRTWTGDTRAVIVVSPNNPTGSFLRADDRDWLASFCVDAGAAVIADEVFAPYPLNPMPDAASFLGQSGLLSFVLGGLSKSAGLPQMKIGWIVVQGPESSAAAALERLSLIADTFLSVSTPAQLATPTLIRAGRNIRPQIQARVSGNLATLIRLVGAGSPVSVLRAEGGWSAVLRVPRTMPEEEIVLKLIADARVLVHPGFFFDFADEAYLVVSLLPVPDVFETAMRRVLPIVAGGTA